jgi:selenocysteine lyase/cysteine desulfurase
MTSRRSFVTRLSGAALAIPALRADAFPRLADAASGARDRAPISLADDEGYWSLIQSAFDVDRARVNLNNGGVSPAPTHVLDAMIRDLRFSNGIPVIDMWQVLEPRLENVRRDLAADFGCDPEEMAIVRNASEANEIMIFGLDLKKGDEVIVTNQNYPRMLTAWDQRARRDGIVVKSVSFDVPSTDDHVVERFMSAVTPRTKVLEVTHITNLTGQILPVRKLVDACRPRGIQVFVDGAHAYAHFPFTRDELGVDYYGTSLHKWLTAPIGTGFLYVRRDRIKALWPLMAAAKSQDADIRKYEEFGTHPAANHNAIAVALAFHRGIGAERKIARLRWLRDRWAKRATAENPRVKVLTPLDGNRAGAIALVQVEGIDTQKLQSWIWQKHGIYTISIIHPEFHGLRVTPNVYTTRDEVDRFGDAILQAARTGIA